MSFTEEAKEIYNSRSILKALVVKNLFGHYKNSFLGFAWHFFNPLMMLIVYYFVFSYIRTSDIQDNWLFIASGLFTFNFILGNLIGGSGCIVANSAMINKMYFPRVLIPLSNVISTFIITLIGYIIVFVCALIFGHPMDLAALAFFPIVLILAFIFSFGCIMFFSSINVYVRDVQYFLSAISMVFFFMTPMYFIAKDATGILGDIIWLNPLTYFVEMCHDTVYWGTLPASNVVITATALSLVVFVIGALTFRKLKHNFAERL